VALQEHFRDVAQGGSFIASSGRDFDFDIGQASDRAAIDADEVRVLSASMLFILHFEPPGVVAGVEASQEARVGQLDQAAIEGRFVESLGNEHVGHVGVADGLAGGGNVLQNSQTRGRAAELGGSQGLAGVLYGD